MSWPSQTWLRLQERHHRGDLILVHFNEAPYADLHFSDSDDDPVFEEMVGNEYKPIHLIITRTVSPLVVEIKNIPSKVLNNRHKKIHIRELETIKRAPSDISTSSQFLSIAIHSVSQAIILAQTYKIALYKNSDKAWCTDYGASEYMFPDYYTFKIYHRLHNFYATLGDTTNLPIEGIVTAIYTLNDKTILTCNALHIPSLCGPLYYLCKHRQQPGCGFWCSYKDLSQLFFPWFFLQAEESFDKIISYRSLGRSHQGTIDPI